MSHEIRTPLNGVLGGLELLGGTALDREQRQLLGLCRNSGERLLNAADDMLDLLRLASGALTLAADPLSIPLLAEAAAARTAERAAERDIEIVLAVDPALPHGHLGDAERLRRILLALLDHAVDAAPAGGEVLFRVTAGQGGLHFAVTLPGTADPGAAMAEASLSLALCERLAALMGGALSSWAADGLGGLRLSLALPPGPAAAPALAGIAGLKAVLCMAGAAGRDALAAPLRAAGVEVRGAADPEAAAALLSAAPDAVLLIDDRLLEGGALPAPLAALAPAVVTLAGPGADGSPPGTVLAKPVRREALHLALSVAAGWIDPAALGAPARPAGREPPDRATAEAEAAVVLVAEDNPTNQTIIAKLLNRLGYVCDVVDDGAAALRALAGAPHYGLLLTDCHMPVMDGYALARALRGRADTAGRLPIVALSADTLAITPGRCREAGMDDYLSKPVDLGRLDAALRRWLPRGAALGRDRAAAEAPPTGADDVLDLSVIAFAFGGIDDDARAMLNDFVAVMAERWAALEDRLGAGDWTEAAEIAHTIKGAANSVGAREVGAVAAGIEDMLRDGRGAAATARLADGPPALARAAEAIARV
ncbi:MAG TPA: response regulator [Alphaproteobacteria bacterium]|nr:response regulator [Alphaproteobacteria bacterium]